MYRNAYQRGMLTIFFSGGSKPLNIWDVHTEQGYVSRFLDQEIKSMVLEIGGTNVSTTYITCPKGKMVLGITMPFLVMIVRNLKKYFSFEVTILDETSTRRRFRVSNFQSTTQILPLCTAMPIGLSDGWNQIQFNLAEFTRRAYKKQFVEVQKLKINANIRLRRIYFAERLLPEDELPPEYKLYFPLPTKGVKDKKTLAHDIDKENIRRSTSQQTIKPIDTLPEVEKVKSAMKVAKTGSKTSVHSIKKTSSRTSRKSSKISVTGKPEQIPNNVAEAQPSDEKPPTEENIKTVNVNENKPPEETAEQATEPAVDHTTTHLSEAEPAAEAAVEDAGGPEVAAEAQAEQT